MKDLIEKYKNEILMAKDAIDRLKDIPTAFQVAQARLSIYEIVVSDLEDKLKKQIEMKLICPDCNTLLKTSNGNTCDMEKDTPPCEYCHNCKFSIYYEYCRSVESVSETI